MLIFQNFRSYFVIKYCESQFTMPRQCKNSLDKFCYICGSLTFKKNKRNISSHVKRLYELYFGIKVGDQEKPWAPHICCSRCFSYLTRWSKGKMKSLPFGIPMIWRESQDHLTDCYFCMVDTQSS